MTCREAHRHLSAARDDALDSSQRDRLAAHLADCAACRRLSDNLGALFATWREASENVRAPDATIEWQKLRRAIRGETPVATSARRPLLAWLAFPATAVAIAAVALFVSPTPPKTDGTRSTIARAGATTAAHKDRAPAMVYVDDKSGWTFVWAEDDGTTRL
jgi:predicted anti-sigma-YlaC factor YlaD